MAAVSSFSPEMEAAEWARVRGWRRSARTRTLSDEAVESRQASAQLVRELREAGVPLQDLAEFANVGLRYDAATQILARHLDERYPDLVWWDIARILARSGPNAAIHRALAAVLRREYPRLSEQTLFSLGLAIAGTAPRSEFDELLEVAGDPRYGAARSGPLLKIAKSKDPRAAESVKQFFDQAREKELWTAVRALRLAKIWSYNDKVAALTKSENYAVREEARSYLRAREKAGG